MSLIIPEVCKSLPDDPLLDPGICAKIKILQLSMILSHDFGFFSCNLRMESALLARVRICFSTSLLKPNRSEVLPNDRRENIFHSTEKRGFVLNLRMVPSHYFPDNFILKNNSHLCLSSVKVHEPKH